MKVLYLLPLLFAINSEAQIKTITASDAYPPPSVSIQIDSKEKPIVESYDRLTRAADMAFRNKRYENAAKYYQQAFKENYDRGLARHRFKAACSFAMIGDKDLAFAELKRIVKSDKYTDLQEMDGETLLESLHSDARWQEIIDKVKANKEHLLNELNSGQKQ